MTNFPSLTFDRTGLERARAGVRGSSFYRSFSLLDAEGQRDLFDFYVFCRLVDDLADEPRADIDVSAHLEAWAFAFDHDFTPPKGWEAEPFFLRIVEISRRRGIPPSLYGDIVRGMQEDLSVVRIPDIPALERYCYRAAGAVGRICVPIFGGDLDRLAPYADRLGEAFQLTNILRDLRQDAERNRIYLPADRMRHFGVTDEDVLAGRIHAGMASLLEEIWNRSEEDYRAAASLLSGPEDRRTMIAARAMETVYHALHRKIRRSGFDVYRKRIGLGPVEKARALFTFWRETRMDRSRIRKAGS
ncbi:MAG: squalene/phytoene synthase family protein [Nitrospirae bacterium]|nr:squalene/phytoene synthase family protein [Nitrospirota bacterium]MCL5285493.1 squalene/phytoene synthase family protein [Nitrospirota bacterium]